MLLVFGGDDPELSPQDQLTPSATPTSTSGVLAVRIGDGTLRVTPGTVARDGRGLFLPYENASDAPIEVVFARGNPEGAKAVQSELVTGAVLPAGRQHRDGVRVDPGRSLHAAAALTR